jgi:hypothetical protein
MLQMRYEVPASSSITTPSLRRALDAPVGLGTTPITSAARPFEPFLGTCVDAVRDAAMKPLPWVRAMRGTGHAALQTLRVQQLCQALQAPFPEVTSDHRTTGKEGLPPCGE